MPFGGALTAGIGAAGSLFGGLFGSSQASKASQQYIDALKQAQGFLGGQEKQGLDNYSPYLQTGANASTTLGSLLGTPGQGLLQNWTGQFTAPTAEEAAQTPGYKFQLQQGLDAAQNSAAGRGSLLTGRTLADLNNYAQGQASTNYQNTFNNAYTQYQSAYNTFNNNQNNTYNRLLGASQQGLGAAGGAGNLISGIGGDIASLYGQQGAAAAAGTLGSANSITGMIPGLTSGFSGLLKSLNPGSGGGLPGGFDPGSIGFCWIAEELYGVDSPKAHAIRGWLKNEYSRTPVGEIFVDWYKDSGERMAEKIKQDAELREHFKSLFDKFAVFAMPSPEPEEDYESVRYQR